jgi:preprotein translocase subunit SecF
MKCSITSKIKTWLVITIAVIVVGMAMLGVLNINKGVDYVPSYEVSVSVDQDVANASETVKIEAEKYFAEKGLKLVSYAYQSMQKGNTHVYKFQSKTMINEQELTDLINQKLNSDKAFAEVFVRETVNPVNYEGLEVLLAAGLAIVAIFLYLLFIEKAASAFSVILVSIISSLVYASLIAITRIPVYPYFGVSVVLAGLLAAVLSSATTQKFKEGLKTSSDYKAIADQAAASSFSRYAIIFIILLITAVALAVAGGFGYLTYVGLALIVADVSAVFASYVWTPVLWTLLKSKK